MAQRTGFLVDVMLGKLARWLRVLGWDAEYVRDKTAEELLAQASDEGRFLLTRKKLDNERVVCIESEVLEEQLIQLEHTFEVISNAQPFTRCIRCNRVLEAVDRQKAADMVPFYTYKTRDEFYLCPGCGKVYWPGSHHQAMMRKVECLKKSLT